MEATVEVEGRSTVGNRGSREASVAKLAVSPQNDYHAEVIGTRSKGAPAYSAIHPTAAYSHQQGNDWCTSLNVTR